MNNWELGSITGKGPQDKVSRQVFQTGLSRQAYDNEIKRQALIAGLQAALPDEDKASRDYGQMAKLMRELGRDEFARQLESIANQEAGHFMSIGYMLDQLKRG